MKFSSLTICNCSIVIYLILFCNHFNEVKCQGNLGVVINNRKLNTSSGVDLLSSSDKLKIKVNKSPPTPPSTKSTIRVSSGILLTKHNYKFYANSPFLENETIIKSNLPSVLGFSDERPPKPELSVPILKDIQTIVDILKQNKSEIHKVNEIVQQLNLKSNQTKIEVVHLRANDSSNINYQRPTFPKIIDPKNYTLDLIAEDSKEKGSKELKVQFVLDCDLKNALNKDKVATGGHRPSTYSYISEDIDYQQQKPQFVSSHTAVKTHRKPSYSTHTTKRPRQKPQFITRATTKAPKSKPKQKQKIKYVDPPGISAISNTFENVYNFFEEALTDNIVFKDPPAPKPKITPNRRRKNNNRINRRRGNGNLKRKKGNFNQRKRPLVKRSTLIDSFSRPTVAPGYRYTQSSDSGQKQKLTTQIHVTSEYVEKDPKPDVAAQDEREPDDYNDSGEDYDDDDDDYYSLDGFSYDDDGASYEDSNYSDSISEEYSDVLPTSHKQKLNKKKKFNKNLESKIVHNSNEIDDDDDDDYYSMPDFGNFFNYAFSSVSQYMPSVPFFDENNENDLDRDEEEGRSTTPRIELRKPKKPSIKYYKDYFSSNMDEVEKRKRWYNPFFYDSSEDGVSTTPLATITTTTPAGFFNWFMGSGEEVTESSIEVSTTETSNPSWIAGLFGLDSPTTTTTTTSTTTHSPPTTTQQNFLSIVNPLQSPQQWLTFLAGHMATSTSNQASSGQQTTSTDKPEKARSKNYSNFQLWRLIPSDQNQLNYLREYKESSDSERIHWLKGPAMRGPTDILIPPHMVKEVKELLEYESIPYDIRIWDLEKAIKYENPPMSIRQKIELDLEQGHPLTWFRYHEYEDITRFLDFLQHNYPNIVQLIHIGRSFEGRPLVVVKISFDGYDSSLRKTKKFLQQNRKKKKTSKPGIFIEAGVHGREWITPAVATWILKELVKHNNKTDATNSEVESIRSVDWYILPVSNPDGYEYSLKFDRMWRKTRSKHWDSKKSVFSLALNWLKRNKKENRPMCYGTDPDRNYDIDWNKHGTSESECNDFYAGPKAFSEPETKALSNFLIENRKSLDIFLSLHSYGQMIAFPGASNATSNMHKINDDLLDMAEVAVNAVRELATSGRYSIDQTNEMLDYGTGTSTEFAMYKVGVKYSYTIELRDTGTQGFLLAPSYIDSTGREAFEMIQAMADYL